MKNSGLVPQMSADEVNALLGQVYPQLNDDFADYRATDVFPGGCTVRLVAGERHLRPGGTGGRGRRSSRWPILAAMSDVLTHGGPDAPSVNHQPQHQPHAQGSSRADRRPLPNPQARAEPDGVRGRHGGPGRRA